MNFYFFKFISIFKLDSTSTKKIFQKLTIFCHLLKYEKGKNMKVINLFGAPGAGKSTTMLGLTWLMKMNQLNVELTTEYFKELVMADSVSSKFGGQLSVLAEQNKRLEVLDGKNDFAVTDCPLPLIGYYTPQNYIPGFEPLVQSLFNKYDNHNYLILRKHDFEEQKRIHDDNQSKDIEAKLPEYLNKMGIQYTVLQSSHSIVEDIFNDLIENQVIQLNKKRKRLTF